MSTSANSEDAIFAARILYCGALEEALLADAVWKMASPSSLCDLGSRPLVGAPACWRPAQKVSGRAGSCPCATIDLLPGAPRGGREPFSRLREVPTQPRFPEASLGARGQRRNSPPPRYLLEFYCFLLIS